MLLATHRPVVAERCQPWWPGGSVAVVSAPVAAAFAVAGTAVAATVLTAVGLAVNTATAAPADAQPISFTAHATDTASIIEIDAGTLRVHDNQLQVTTADGRVVAATPLSFVLDDFTFPITASKAAGSAIVKGTVELM